MKTRHDASDRLDIMRACRRPAASEGCRLLRYLVLCIGFSLERVAAMAGASPAALVVSWLAGESVPDRYGRERLQVELGIPWESWRWLPRPAAA